MRPLWLALLAGSLALAACDRERRELTTTVSNTRPAQDASRLSALQPAEPLNGDTRLPASNRSPYDENAYAVNQGKRLFRWYNCSGCHASGGGGIGPALMDSQWIYGNEPAQIFETIVRGRPNGMPSFGGHIPEDQVWQIVAYVRSMDRQLRKDVAPNRSDSLNAGPPESTRTPYIPPGVREPLERRRSQEPQR